MPLKEEIEVPVLSLADFFDIFPFDILPMIDYIKIDAQGSDLDIVKGAAKYMQERVVSITLEDIEEGYDARYTGSYRGCVNTIRDIDSYMEGIGFRKYFTERTYDPTYVNEKFLDCFLSHDELQIFQKG